METVNPYMFVVGAPRSGTTLLQRILDAHPLLTVPNDADFIWRAPGVRGGGDPPLTPKLVEWVQERRVQSPIDPRGSQLARLELDEDEVARAAERASCWSEFVGAMYDEVSKKRGKRLAGQKDPTYAQRVWLLYSLFPRAKFIHIIRDGRDVALSMFDWAKDKRPGKTSLWAESPAAYCALQWRAYVLAAVSDGAKLPEGQFMQLWYENLVASPAETAGSICRFLDIPFAVDEMTSFHVGKQTEGPADGGPAADRLKRAWAPPQKGARAWREVMSQDEVALFEAIAGDALVRLGYPLTVEASDDLREQADRCRTWWRAGQPDEPVLRPRATTV